MKILADFSLPHLLKAFPSPFQVTFYNDPKKLSSLLKAQDILICRANLKVTSELIEDSNLKCVATASSGTDHIDKQFLQKQKIELFDAKGGNASAVADYVLACFAYLKRYNNFEPQKVGIIGVGMVGSLVADYLKKLNLEVVCYDPLKAQLDPGFQNDSLEDVLTCDLICLHPNLHEEDPYSSLHLINHTFLKRLKPHTAIINASRGDVVDEEALLSIFSESVEREHFSYCTDVYRNEPSINPRIVEIATLCTPHIAGHSIEAKEETVYLLSRKIHARFGLSTDHIPEPIANLSDHLSSLKRGNWENLILSLYNPAKETIALKKSILFLERNNFEQAFLKLRQAHRFRHNFHHYITGQ